MSQKNRLLGEMKRASRKAGGAHLTLQARDNHLGIFCDFCASRRFGLTTISQIKTKHVLAFANFLRESDRTVRTIHNILASIRSAVRAAGKNLENMRLVKNADLGLAPGSRKGTKEPIPDRVLFPLLILLASSNLALFVALAFERFLGLRGMEALRSRESLITWRKQLDAGKALSVTFGTKGGKPRSVMIHPRNLPWLRLALSAAMEVTKAGRSPLIHAPTLKQAVRHYRYECQKIGLIGKYAPHSLRYRFAIEMREYFREQGFSQREALARVSLNLGHGDSRGRWVRMVYGRSAIERD